MAEESESVRVNSAAKKSGAETGSADDGIGRFSGKFSAMRFSFRRSDRGAETVGGWDFRETKRFFYLPWNLAAKPSRPTKSPERWTEELRNLRGGETERGERERAVFLCCWGQLKLHMASLLHVSVLSASCHVISDNIFGQCQPDIFLSLGVPKTRAFFSLFYLLFFFFKYIFLCLFTPF